jgi:Ca-activated chloride channel family protein
MIHLAHPAFLTVGILLLLPYLLQPRRAWQYSSVQILPTGKRVGLAVLCTASISVVALTLLLLALARPQRLTRQIQRTMDARDVVLTLDLSLSMEEYLPGKDEATRGLKKLDLIQRAALDFVKQHTSDRLGLIVFGDEAFGVWPLSIDSTTLQRRLQHLDTLLPAQVRGTNVAKALVTSLDHLQARGQGSSKMVLLLTDGVDRIEPGEAERILQRLRREQVMLYVLGMQLNDDASVVSLARQAQGRYFAIDQAEALDQVFRDIEHMETSRVSVTREMGSEDLYRLFAFPGLVLLLAATVCKSVWVLEI